MRILRKLILSFLVFGTIVLIIPAVKIEKQVKASNVYEAVSGNLIVGTTATKSNANVGSYRGVLASDSHYWSITRTAAVPSLDVQFSIPGVQLNNANKLIVTIEDSNTTTATAYEHMICDWTSSTSVDFAADANCTGGGWRKLHPRKTTYTSTSDVNRTYDLYNGYFVDRSGAAPGTFINTPMSNFISSGTNTVLIRLYSGVSSTTQYNADFVIVETAIDPVYEPADFTNTSGGTLTNYISDIFGNASTINVNPSDGNKFQIAMPAVSQAVDNTFTFKDVRTYTGANTIVLTSEVCVSNVALTFDFQIRNFTGSTWTDINGTDFTGTACGTDTEYAFSFNSTTSGGFTLSDHINGSNEIQIRLITNAPGTAYNIQLDRMFIMLGSVNTDTAQCEISWGTGTATNCSNTRSINEARTGTPATTWQATAVLEYPTTYYALDNDDDATNAEYAASQNLSFPVTVDNGMVVTGIHYAAKYRSNSTAQTADLQVRDSSGITINGTVGWQNTPGTDTNALTTYSWFDSYQLGEYNAEPSRAINTVTNNMNLRLRTSAGTTTDPGTRDWSFAMMSIRWTEQSGNRTRNVFYAPTGGNLAVGTQTATSNSNVGSWAGALGSDDATNNNSNYWTVARTAAAGLDLQIQFDNVEIYGANTIIITMEDTNITTGSAYTHQICDWVSSTDINNAADSSCTGGGWRDLDPMHLTYTNTTDQTRVYRIYDGYFSTRAVSPGAPIVTPLSNFVKNDSSKRVLVRTYSSILSTVQYRIDQAQVEAAIDPYYYVNNFTKINGYDGTTSNAIGDLFGNGNKMGINNTNTNPIDFYINFTDIRTYTGMNTILVRSEICVNNVALTFNLALYNYTTTSWEDLSASPITGTVCATDSNYANALNNITDMNDYISNGESRLRIYTTTLNTFQLQLDQVYLMFGTTNTDNTLCEISWGTGTATDCSKTRDIDGVTTSSSATNTWQVTSTLEYPASDYYGQDNDNDGVNAEAAFASNLSFGVTRTSGMTLTGIAYAARFRSNVTTITLQPQFRDFSGRAGGGYTTFALGNALTTYNYNDSTASSLSIASTNVNSFHNEVTNRINVRLRTTGSTLTSAGTVNDWDFMMVSLRWIEDESGVLSVDIVDGAGASVASPSVTFPTKITNFACQTSTGTFGTSSEKIRITNDSSSPAWSLSLSADGGIISTWDTGATDEYDFNDPSGIPAGCGDGGDADSLAGQLTIDLSSAVITPQGGCSSTGITLGTNSGFNQGTTDSVLLVQASGSADTHCYWDITDIAVVQQIPASQASGNYAIPMTLTVVAN